MKCWIIKLTNEELMNWSIDELQDRLEVRVQEAKHLLK